MNLFLICDIIVYICIREYYFIKLMKFNDDQTLEFRVFKLLIDDFQFNAAQLVEIYIRFRLNCTSLS